MRRLGLLNRNTPVCAGRDSIAADTVTVRTPGGGSYMTVEEPNGPMKVHIVVVCPRSLMMCQYTNSPVLFMVAAHVTVNCHVLALNVRLAGTGADIFHL